MTVEKVLCDECGRVKAEANHWHQIMIWESKNSGVMAIAAGKISDLLELTRTAPPVEPSVHDLCGEQCFHKHIAKLLGFNPPATSEDAA